MKREESFEGLCDILARDFSPGNEKGYDMDARQVYMTKRSMGQKIDGPLDGKWFQGAVIEFLNNYKEGTTVMSTLYVKFQLKV